MILKQFCEQLDLADGVLLSCWISCFKRDDIAAGIVPCQEQLCPAILCPETREALVGAGSDCPGLSARLPGSWCCTAQSLLRSHPGCLGACGIICDRAHGPQGDIPGASQQHQGGGLCLWDLCMDNAPLSWKRRGESLQKPQASQTETAV